MKLLIFAFAMSILVTQLHAYEINNHADMTQRALEISPFNSVAPTGKLARLGLNAFPLGDPRQLLPIDASLGPIPYCFGSARPKPWAVVIDNPANFPPQ